MASGVFYRAPLAERFWQRVDIRGDDECWPSQAGAIWADGSTPPMRRALFIVLGKPLIAHESPSATCKTPTCVNPKHIRIVTRKQRVFPNFKKIVRTHCRKGHELTPENTRPNPNGSSACRTCMRATAMRWKTKSVARKRKQRAVDRIDRKLEL